MCGWQRRRVSVNRFFNTRPTPTGRKTIGDWRKKFKAAAKSRWINRYFCHDAAAPQTRHERNPADAGIRSVTFLPPVPRLLTIVAE